MLGKSGMPLNCAIQIKKIGRNRLDSEFRPVNVFNNQLLTVKFVFFYCFQNNFLPCSCTCNNMLQNLCKLNHHIFKQAPTNPLPRPQATKKYGQATNISNRISDFSSPAIVIVSIAAHIQSVNTLSIHSKLHITHSKREIRYGVVSHTSYVSQSMHGQTEILSKQTILYSCG